MCPMASYWPVRGVRLKNVDRKLFLLFTVKHVCSDRIANVKVGNDIRAIQG